MKAKRLFKAKRPSLDRMTTLPETIIETILCLLPIQEAARTSILSREWRYKWTTIPTLEFCDFTLPQGITKGKQLSNDSEQKSDVASARKYMDKRCKLFSVIHQVLLLRQGPIHEFTLVMYADYTCFKIDQIILHLSRNHTLKKLTLNFLNESCSVSLPLSLFSLHHLKELCLVRCDFNHKQICNGFGSLTSLTLNRTKIARESFLYLLSNCPSLKRLCLLMHEEDFHDHKYPSVMELFKCLPVIEHLTITGYLIPSLLQATVPKELPVKLIHLKYFRIKQMSFANFSGWTFLGLLIICSWNLEKIELQFDVNEGDDEIEPHKFEEYLKVLKEHSAVRLEHLTELKICHFSNSKPELEFMKFVLARSPNLKKVIWKTHFCDEDQGLELLRILLRAPNASPVEIIVENCFEVSDDED